MSVTIDGIRSEISHDPSNAAFTKLGYQPLFVADARARIVIIGQAPGIKAQKADIAWGDASGQNLMRWLGIDEQTFRDKTKISLIPMDFYYPGKGKSGDLPPRKDFAPRWHPQLLALMPNVKLIILVGQYAQKYYLGKAVERNLTETVKNFEAYLPEYFPLVHPSPLNFRWQAKNPWFETDVIPVLRAKVRAILE